MKLRWWITMTLMIVILGRGLIYLLTITESNPLPVCESIGIEAYSPDIGGPGTKTVIISPNHDYAAETRSLGHDCFHVTVYDCGLQESYLAYGGCSPQLDWNGLADWVIADGWVSDHELQVLYEDDHSEILDMHDVFPRPTPVPDPIVSTSPDGEWAVFRYYNYMSGSYELYRARPDGTKRQDLPMLVWDHLFYGWSADSEWMLVHFFNEAIPSLMQAETLEYHPLFVMQGEWIIYELSQDSQWMVVSPYSKGYRVPILYQVSVPEGKVKRVRHPLNPLRDNA